MKKVLVANRGEIACRIVASCRTMGIRTVAVHSEADANALHVALADESVAIGPAPARESYLRADRLLDAARTSGADAIHPGYGFLAENAAFAEQVQAAGLAWIGPSPRVIRDMGDKQRARTLAFEAGVPILPGSERFAVGDLAKLEQSAERVGYPLLVKAAAGGGGIGMRRVDAPEKLREIAEATQSMAAKAFGDGTIYLERYIERARHVEIQVFGFGNGHAVHLYERDCSIQRRFQKVIEESPAPGLPADIRAQMAEAATRLSGDERYEGAGTIEFVVDADSLQFYFLEMNTRIQVEHPVTEMTTGRDLVAMQIEQARGTLDRIDQHDIVARGHAIECRLYAENPTRNFMPSPGRLTRFELPQRSPEVRIDTGFRAGDEVTFFYDPMIAKVICHGPTRAAAIERTLQTLAGIDIGGLTTNIDFLRATLDHPEFRAGRVYTGFVDNHKASLIAPRSAASAMQSAGS
ncbi:MAG TPA: biotin carboxylase N-terminal domain-containing protein [Casimicrobiaceae bacterium]|nr:biotin carboxylase N-terminal domain-containing protein [Casimicrobiaceae bacterium]